MEDEQFTNLLRSRRTIREFSDDPVSLSDVNRLLWAAQGITSADGKRTVPSAHALYPLQLCLSASRIDGLEAGNYKADSIDPTILVLQRSGDCLPSLRSAALDGQNWISGAAGAITVCADMSMPLHAFANQPPYGSRGLRYVYIEAGGVAQNVQLQATVAGIGCALVAGFSDETTNSALGLEAPICAILHLCFGHMSS